MGFPTIFLIEKLNISFIRRKEDNIENIVDHKRLITLYYKKTIP